MPSFRADDVHPIFKQGRQDAYDQAQDKSAILADNESNMNQPLLARTSDITDREFINEIEGRNNSSGTRGLMGQLAGDPSSGGALS